MEFVLETPQPVDSSIEKMVIEIAAKENKLAAIKYLHDCLGRDNFQLVLWKKWIDERDPLIYAIKQNRSPDEVPSFSYSDMIDFSKFISELFDIQYDYSSPADLVREYLQAKREGKVFTDNLGR